MNDVIKTRELKNGNMLKIFYDFDAQSPRDWDNLGTIKAWHSKYDLGDDRGHIEESESFGDYQFIHKNRIPKQYRDEVKSLLDDLLYPEDSDYEFDLTNPQQFELYLQCINAIYLNVYMYEHGNIALSTGTNYPFNDRWDAGQLGFIYVTRDKALEEYSRKRITKQFTERIEGYLRGEIKTYSQYVSGQVYGWVTEDSESNHIDSCWGYYDIQDILTEVGVINE